MISPRKDKGRRILLENIKGEGYHLEKIKGEGYHLEKIKGRRISPIKDKREKDIT